LSSQGDETGRACSTYERRKEMRVGFWWKSQKERDHWEDIHAGGRVILKWILET
jgi:hypothetical protein